MTELELEINEVHALFPNLGPLPAFSLPSHPYLQPFFFIEFYRLWVCDVFIYSERIFIVNVVKLNLKIQKSQGNNRCQ